MEKNCVKSPKTFVNKAFAPMGGGGCQNKGLRLI